MKRKKKKGNEKGRTKKKANVNKRKGKKKYQNGK